MKWAPPKRSEAFTGTGYLIAAALALDMANAPGSWQVPWQVAGTLALTGLLPVFGALARLRHLLVRLRESEARYRLLADHSSDVIMSTLPNGRIQFVSPSVLQFLQHQPEALIGRRALRLVAPAYRRAVLEACRKAGQNTGSSAQVEFMALPALAEPRWFATNLRAVINERGQLEALVSVTRDMAERKAHETALALAAMTDPLTGLPNRRMFMKAAEECQHSGRVACVALFDLDHFKAVNDTYGHGAGDAVLRDFATIARASLRASDTIARLGGEEFALLLPGTGLETAQLVCTRIAASLGAHTTQHEGADIRITTSIGLARLTQDTAQALAAADQALYAAKAAGRARLKVAA